MILLSEQLATLPPIHVRHGDVVLPVGQGGHLEAALAIQWMFRGVCIVSGVVAVLQLGVLGSLLLERVLQHLDSANEVILEVLLAFPFALKECYPSLKSRFKIID